MDKQEIIHKIMAKREYSQLLVQDVEMAFSHFARRETSDEEKVKLTRDLLHKIFWAFSSQKLLNKKIISKKSAEEILKKHVSTSERFDYYEEIYSRILNGMGKKMSIIDLGAGINGLSYNYLNQLGFDVNYIGVEAVGQLVELMNNYFFSEKINALASHLSLFQPDDIKKIIEETDKPRIIFLFKTVDSLEMLEKDYSKKLISELISDCDRFVVSFATKSLAAKKSFSVKRYWFENFVKANFQILDDFEVGGERYIVFRK